MCLSSSALPEPSEDDSKTLFRDWPTAADPLQDPVASVLAIQRETFRFSGFGLLLSEEAWNSKSDKDDRDLEASWIMDLISTYPGLSFSLQHRVAK
ncbi:hypothetical protein HN011_009829 [Eciton burchellii]|nr:hypothetical protein HN011_009829 [Eciton burchellii]